MSIAPLFSFELDWLHPSLAEAEPDRDLSKAIAAIRKHLQSLSIPLSRLDLCGNLEQQAGDLLERRVGLLNEVCHLDTPVNWQRLAETDAQRNWHLGYMYWLNPLAHAYEQSGEERYARQWKSYVEEFLEGCPYAADARGYHPTRDMVLNDKKTCNLGENGGPRHKDAPPEQRHQWMSLSCHFRIDTWLAGLTRMAGSPELDDAFLAKCLLSLTRDHAFVCVMNPRENTPNQFTAVTMSLLRLSVALPMFRSHASQFLVAWERLQRVFSNTMYPDGSDAEQSPNYNLFLLDLCVELLDLLKETPDSRTTPIRKAARKRLEFLEAMQTPDGQLPPIAKGHLEPLRERLAHARSCLGLPPAPPPPSSSHFPYGGYHVLRSDQSWLLFKNSPPGNGHMHEDCLSFQLWLEGKEVLSDPSQYTYELNTAEQKELNEWALSTAGHNAVLINGEGQRRIQLRSSGSWNHDEVPDLRASEAAIMTDRIVGNEQLRFVEGSYADGVNGTERIVHRRQILELRGKGWLILDWVDQEAEVTRCWQFAPRLKDLLRQDGASVQGPEFQMLDLSPDPEWAWEDRYHFPEYAVKIPAKELRWNNRSTPERPLLTWITQAGGRTLPVWEENTLRWGENYELQISPGGNLTLKNEELHLTWSRDAGALHSGAHELGGLF